MFSISPNFCSLNAYSMLLVMTIRDVCAVVQLLSHIWLLASHGLEHARLPCPLLPPRACSKSCPLSGWCHPTISPSSPPPFNLSRIRVFSNELPLWIRWPKYWSFSFSISPSNEYSGLTSFRIDWFDLLAVQGTLKSLLQHHSSKASGLRYSAFFMVQLSHPYMTTGKAIVLTRGTHLSANYVSAF